MVFGNLTRRDATEELLAEIAEAAFSGSRLSNSLRSFWNMVCQLFHDFFRSLGFADASITEGDLKSMLWSSYRNLKNSTAVEAQATYDASLAIYRQAESQEAQRQYDEVIARYTNSDGTKKPGWMKAPNGKPTNLTDRQWVYVRTNNFKCNFFGFWDLKSQTTNIVKSSGKVPFRKKVKDAIEWAESHGVVETMTEEETNGKGRISISKSSLDEMLNPRQREQSVSNEIHFAVIQDLKEIIRKSILAEQHPDYNKDENGKRSPLKINPNVKIQIIYGAYNYDGEVYRVKTTMKKFLDPNFSIKAYAYDVRKIEVLAGTLGSPNAVKAKDVDPTASTSITASILLDGVRNVNGNLTLEDHMPLDENGEPILDNDKTMYRKITDKKEVEELEKSGTMKVYRAVVKINGQFYPPMMSREKVNGKFQFVEPITVGDWYRSDERLDKIKFFKEDKESGRLIGYLDLSKSNKKTTQNVAYNPYFHTSSSGLNDQFSEAQDRPEIVIVESEIPLSELTSGYRAEYAKDPVGKANWHSGTANAVLPDDKKRVVYLSRYSKIIREVPYEEVADRVAELYKDIDYVFPSNVLHPKLRTLLEERGFKILETDNRGQPKTSAERLVALEAKATAGGMLVNTNTQYGSRHSVGSMFVSMLVNDQLLGKNRTDEQYLEIMKGLKLEDELTLEEAKQYAGDSRGQSREYQGKVLILKGYMRTLGDSPSICGQCLSLSFPVPLFPVGFWGGRQEEGWGDLLS